jgi:hypothetical protein
MQRPNLLEFDHYRYLKAAGLVIALAIIAYLADQPDTGAYGGTLLGYLFGVLAAIIAVAEALYGLRKPLTPKFVELRQFDNLSSSDNDRRAHASGSGVHQGGALQGWLSAHVYFGVAIVVLATLHTGFQFGWDVHTLAYALMMIVVTSGFYGVYAYLRFPRLMTNNMGGADTLETLLLKIEDFDKLASIKSLQFSDEICGIVLKSRQETLIGGNIFQQLTAHRRNCPTARAIRQLHFLGKGLKGEQLKSFNELYSILVLKDTLVTRARKEIMYKARLEFWLYLHAPLSSAFVTALVAHIVAIFFYW